MWHIAAPDLPIRPHQGDLNGTLQPGAVDKRPAFREQEDDTLLLGYSIFMRGEGETAKKIRVNCKES
jgi:hypothetical protein